MITCNEIRDKIRKWETFSISPDRKKFPHYNSGYIFDVDKSVRWNREQVDIANKAYAEESIRLTTERNELYHALLDTVKEYIIQETHCNKTQSNLIRTFVCDYNHDDFIEILEGIIEFYNDLKVDASKIG